jgi:hypothetical protein
MADDPIKKCASCGADDGFTDYPEGMAEARWPSHDWEAVGGAYLMTMCNHCGASFPQTSVDASVRAPVPDHHAGNPLATVVRMRMLRPGVKKSDIPKLKAKLAELEGD